MVSQSIVFINFSVFATWWIMLLLEPSMAIQAVVTLGFQPMYLESPGFGLLTLISAMFMHGSPMHLLMNMLILILLGVPFEDRIGSRSFLRIYFISGIIGSLLIGLISVWNQAGDLETIHIGASGAVFGIMGGFVLLYPRDEIPMLLGPIFMHRVPVFLSTIVLVGMETLYVGMRTNDGIGHGTHMASFIAGVFLAPYYSSKIDDSESSVDFDTSQLSKVFEKTKVGSHELKMIEESDEPELVNAWVEKFWELQKCPDCNTSLTPEAECLDCGKDYLN
jgi:membrane associated rhomboid family serine protease